MVLRAYSTTVPYQNTSNKSLFMHTFSTLFDSFCSILFIYLYVCTMLTYVYMYVHIDFHFILKFANKTNSRLARKRARYFKKHRNKELNSALFSHQRVSEIFYGMTHYKYFPVLYNWYSKIYTYAFIST